MIDNEELILIQIEIQETNSLIQFALQQNLPLSQQGFDYLIQRVRFLKKQLTDMETQLLVELHKQITSN